jgi:16S rRNA (guanine527-N7)-methyltransferase
MPHAQWVLIDSARKRCQFLDRARAGLGAGNVSVHCVRAEDAGRDPALREQQDAVVWRALGPLALGAEYCLPLVKVGGRCLALKGPAVERELSEGSRVARELGGRVVEVAAYRLPLGDEQRRAVVIEKVMPTPECYPRRIGVAAKRRRKVDRRDPGV